MSRERVVSFPVSRALISPIVSVVSLILSLYLVYALMQQKPPSSELINIAEIIVVATFMVLGVSMVSGNTRRRSKDPKTLYLEINTGGLKRFADVLLREPTPPNIKQMQVLMRNLEVAVDEEAKASGKAA